MGLDVDLTYSAVPEVNSYSSKQSGTGLPAAIASEAAIAITAAAWATQFTPYGANVDVSMQVS
jgi:hypothetical protein